MSCIEHTQQGGHGRTRYRGKNIGTHRVAYIKANNLNVEDIAGLVVRHTCDNPRCINPEHLLIGTREDNMQDMTTRNRQNKGECRPQAILTNEAVHYIKSNYRARCRTNGQRALARKYNVSQKAIFSVLQGDTWKHITVGDTHA